MFEWLKRLIYRKRSVNYEVQRPLKSSGNLISEIRDHEDYGVDFVVANFYCDDSEALDKICLMYDGHKMSKSSVSFVTPKCEKDVREGIESVVDCKYDLVIVPRNSDLSPGDYIPKLHDTREVRSLQEVIEEK